MSDTATIERPSVFAGRRIVWGRPAAPVNDDDPGRGQVPPRCGCSECES